MTSRRAAKRLTPAELLFSQGFGTRRECAALVANGMLEVEGIGTVDDDRELDVGAGEVCFRVAGGERWPYRERATLSRCPRTRARTSTVSVGWSQPLY
jgi:16S rRNA pseudouridine516 synthase